MHYEKISNKTLTIGEVKIFCSKNSVLDQIIETANRVIFNIYPSEEGIDWNDMDSHFLWRERVRENPQLLFAYDFSGRLMWKFPSKNVTGFESEVPELKKEADFATPEHYQKYVGKYKGKELLIVYAGDFQYRVDAESGEIYGKSITR
ncbi:MAG: hypothetical protein RIC30_08720 [Marinoscillum sp.]|uniref:hypothetical protein n=1 Tax=Marinoscillum sp. TaxID=2024838 RepID=UPI003302BAE3